MKLFIFGSMLALACLLPRGQALADDVSTQLTSSTDQSVNVLGDTNSIEENLMRPPGGGDRVGHGYGGDHFRDGYRGGRYGYHGGRFIGYPGFYAGWGWDFGWTPFWWTATLAFPIWAWEAGLPAGYWQCTAFNQEMQPFMT